MPTVHRVMPPGAVLALVLLGAALAAQEFPAVSLDAGGRVPYFIAEGTAQASYRTSDRELAEWALRAWERSAGGSIRFEEVRDESSAVIRLYWVPASDGQYGEMRSLLLPGGKRGAAVYIRPDTDALGPDIAREARADPLLRDTIVYLTCVHELGHALGLSHTPDFRDIMYFFGYGGDIPEFFGRYRRLLRVRADIAQHAGLSSADIARMRARYPK